MILPGKLFDLLFLLRKELRHIRGTFYVMHLSVRSHKCILLFGTQRLQILLSSKILFAAINLPHSMIKAKAVRASITELRRKL